MRSPYREAPQHRVLCFVASLAYCGGDLHGFMRYYEQLVEWMIDTMLVPTTSRS